MEKKIKIRIGYPWAQVPDDVDIVTISGDIKEEEIPRLVFDEAVDMIFNRIDFTWEEVE